MRSGGDIRKSKELKNIIQVPLLQFPNHKLVLEAILPMKLYLLRGVVNHLFKSLCDLWPGAKEQPEKLHIPIQPYHGGHFNGNDCMKFLRGLDKLQQLSETASISQTHGFIHTLTLFKEVVTACFGNYLDLYFKPKIFNFK